MGVDAVYQYIIIEDYNSALTMAMEVVPVDGVSQYTFTGIPAGEYLIFAGTNTDNSVYFCDTGEACGSYSTSPRTVTSDMSGVNFVSGFTISGGGASVGAASTPVSGTTGRAK